MIFFYEKVLDKQGIFCTLFNTFFITSHVLLYHRNGKRPRPSKLKIGYRLFVGMFLVGRLSFF